MHSEKYVTGTAWRGRDTLVLGTGTSGHDVAQDLHAAGAKVTLIQRSPTYVVSLKEAQRVYSMYTEGIPFDDCDLFATSLPYPVLLRSYELSTEVMHRNDAKLFADLAATNFQLDFQENDPGFQMRYLQRGGGYYFNVGCSNLIIDGKIGVMQFTDIERFVPEGVLMRDGTAGRITGARNRLLESTGSRTPPARGFRRRQNRPGMGL